MAPRNQTRGGGDSIAHDVVFGNFGDDDLDLDNNDGADDDLDDDAGDDGQGDDDSQLDDLRGQQDDQDGLDDLTDNQRQRQRGQRQEDRRPRRDQYGRQRQQQRGRGQQDDIGQRVLDDLGVSHTRVHSEAQVESDKDGNLISKESGKIVARAGREARYYQNAEKARRQVVQHQGRVRDVEGKLSQAIGIASNLDTQLKTLQGQAAHLKQLGIEPADQLMAVRLFKDLKDNPVATIRGILTRAQARGITMDQLGLGAGGGSALDAKAMSDMIGERINQALGPIQERVNQSNQQEQQTRENEQAKNAAIQEVQTFFNTNPEAAQYERVFQQLLADPNYRNMSLREMWAEIRLSLSKQPRRQQRPDRRNQQYQTPLRGRMPTGRRAPMQGTGPELAPVDQEYGEILNGIMDEVGIR